MALEQIGVLALPPVAYLLGCIPFGLIVARARGVDLRAAGSGNIGATNALRVMGKGAGAITLAGDVLKGAAAVYIAYRVAGRDTGMPVLAAGAAVLGHDYPVFTGFKGGKGVATSIGGLLALDLHVGLVCVIIWIAAVAVFRISSLGALVSFATLPFLVAAMRGAESRLMPLSVFMAALIILKHKDNIKRLLKGEESRIGRNRPI